MRRLFLCFIVVIVVQVQVFAAIKGEIQKDYFSKMSRILDSATGQAIPYAKIDIPALNYSTITDGNGQFHLKANLEGPAVLSVQKEGYKPFSVTIDKMAMANPLMLGIDKSTITSVSLETGMVHIGDNNFSSSSANAGDFRYTSVGPYYTKSFRLKMPQGIQNAYFVIGSIIGLDTVESQRAGQSRVKNTFATPAQIYFNGQLISELKLNGDGVEIKLPRNLIRQNMTNEVTIQSGKNAFKTDSIDYDDIELTNMSIEMR